MAQRTDILKHIVLVFLVMLPLLSYGQGNVLEREQPSQYIADVLDNPKPDFFQGFSMFFDLFSPIQRSLSDFGGIEGGLRLNLLNTYFPVVEIGYGNCDHTDNNTHIKYKTNAPYFKAGIDFNLLKDKFSDNRLYVGLRYGFSTYKFDISGPAIADPIWGGSEPFSYKGINATSHWAEAVFGFQVKMWKSFHMGWSVRLKREIHSSSNDISQPYYIPGYGSTSQDTSWGGTYHLIFDLNWGKKRTKVENIELIGRPVEEISDSITTPT